MKNNMQEFSNRPRQIHLDFHTPDHVPGFMSRFSAKEFAGTLKESHVQGIRVFAKCHWGNSYYSTEAGKKHPMLKRDLLAEMASALRENDILCYGYYSTLIDWSATAEHPEWLSRTVTGGEAKRGLICPNSGYVEELLLPQVRELVKYPLDGLWFDIITMPGDMMACFCDSCRRIFREETGKEMSEELFEEDEFILPSFRRRSLDRMMRKIAAIRDEMAPEMAIIHNSAGLNYVIAYNHDGENYSAADACSNEAQPCCSLGYVAHEHRCRVFRPKNMPFEVTPVRFMYGWGEGTLKPLAQMNYENGLILANGGVINLGDHLDPSGILEPAVYGQIEKSYEFIKEREEFVTGTQSIRYAAVLNRAECMYWNRSQLGAERLLSDAHVQTEILDNTVLGRLDQYKILVVGDRAPSRRGNTLRKDAYLYPIPRLSDSQVERIFEWVEAGGRLIADGNAFTSECSAELAEKLLGVRVGKKVADKGFLCVEGGNECNEASFPVKICSSFHEAEALDAKPLAGWKRCLVEDSYAGKSFPADKVEGGAVFCRELGKGKVLYFATQFFVDFANTRYPALRKLFWKLAGSLFEDLPVRIDGNPSLRTNVRRDDSGTLYIDLLFAHAEQPVVSFPAGGIHNYPAIEQEYPLHDIDVFVRDVSPESVTLEPGARPMEWQARDGGVVIRVPEVRTYDIVKITE